MIYPFLATVSCLNRCLKSGVHFTLQAIKSFFLTLDGHEDSAEYSTFEDKVNQVHFGIAELIKLQYGKPSPIQVLNRSFIKTDFASLKERFGE